MSIPDYAEPLIGWRVWRVDDRCADVGIQPRLISAVVGDSPWEPFCALQSKHLDVWGMSGWWNEIPLSEQHGPASCAICGIYAYRTEADARANMEKQGPCIVGSVKLWGEIVVHERGYRAQFAYPDTFVYAQECNGAALARAYGVSYKEDPSWKSVVQREQSLSNPWPIQFPSGNAWLGLPRFPSLFTANQPWTSQYLLHPDDHKFIVEPPEPKLPTGVKIPDIVKPKQWQRASGIWAPCVESDYSVGVDVGEEDSVSFMHLTYGTFVKRIPVTTITSTPSPFSNLFYGAFDTLVTKNTVHVSDIQEWRE